MFRASASSRITRFMYSGQYSRRPYWRAASHSFFNNSLSQIMVFLRLDGFTASLNGFHLLFFQQSSFAIVVRITFTSGVS